MDRHRLTYIYLALAAVLLTASAADATTRYVDNTTTSCTNGSSTYDPATDTCGSGSNYVYTTIDNALSASSAGDTIIVADGTYTDTNADDRVVSTTKAGSAGGGYITIQAENQCATSGGTTTCYAIIDCESNATDFGIVMSAGAAYLKWEGFEIKDCAWDGFYMNASGVNHIELRNNYIHDIGRVETTVTNGRNGVLQGKGVSYITYDRNIFSTIGRLATNCADTCYNHDHGIYAFGHDNTITNNIFYNLKSGWGIQISGSATVGDGPNWYIINNTFADANPGRTGHIVMWKESGGTAPSNVIVQNNISYNPTTAFFYFSYLNGAQSVYLYNNLVYGAGSLTAKEPATYTPTYTESGNDIGGNPLFTDAANRDYTLQMGSDAIGLGLENAYSPDHDFLNAARPSGSLWDAGAYEREAGQTPSTYFVDPDAGSDSNSGESSVAPFKTLDYVNGRTWVAGDTYNFKRGTTSYGKLTLPEAGTAGAHITVGAYSTGDLPVISATQSTTGWISSGSAPDACSASPSDADGGDLVCEDFEGAGYLGTWTEVTTGATIAEDTAHSGTLSCTDKGSQALQVIYTAASTDGYARKDLGAQTTTTYIRFEVNVKDTGTITDGQWMSLFVTEPGIGTYLTYYIRANRVSATTYNFQLRFKDTLGATVGTATSSTFDEDTWHEIAIEHKTNNNTLKMWVDGTLVNNETTAANDRDPRYIFIGAENSKVGNQSGDGIFQIDNLKIDDDTMPATCSTSGSANIWTLSGVKQKPDTVKISGSAGTEDAAGCPAALNAADEWCHDNATEILYLYELADPTTDVTLHWNYAITTNGKAYVDIKDIAVNGATTANILMNGNNGTLNRVWSLDGSGDCLQITGTGAAITYSIFDSCTGDGLQLDAGATGATVYNAVSYGNGGQGYNLDETVTVKNSIADTNTGDDINIDTGKTVTGVNNLIEDAAKGGAGTYSDTGTTWNWTADFTNAASGDFTRTAKDDGVDLSLTLDFVSNAVKYCTAPDIGVYEKQSGCSGRKKGRWAAW